MSSQIKVNVGLAIAIALGGFGGGIRAQQQPQPQQQQPQPMIVHPLKDGVVYWIQGGGGNSGVIIGQTGVVVVDAKIRPDAGQQMIAEIAKLTPKPITHVILTHSDCDHVNGLVAFPDTVAIVAHENEKKEQEAALKEGGLGAPPPNRFPTQVVAGDRESLNIDGINFVLLHFGPAHTTGDLMVYLPDQKIVFAGDILTTTILIHPDRGGILDGWFKTANGLLALDADSYVPGHGTTVETKAGLQKRIDDYQAKRNEVDAMIKEGKSLAEIKVAMGDPAVAPSGCRGIPFPSFSETEYQFHTNKK